MRLSLILSLTTREQVYRRSPRREPDPPDRGGRRREGGHRDLYRYDQAWQASRGVVTRFSVSPYWLRHAHGSRLRGADLALVRDTLGHASIETTGRYVQARPHTSSSLFLPRCRIAVCGNARFHKSKRTVFMSVQQEQNPLRKLAIVDDHWLIL